MSVEETISTSRAPDDRTIGLARMMHQFVSEPNTARSRTFDDLSVPERERFIALAEKALRPIVSVQHPLDQRSVEVTESLARWTRNLEDALDDIRTGRNGTRGWTFDMDDQPELSDGVIEQVPEFAHAIEFLRDELEPVWKQVDDEALGSQRKHTVAANAAIWSGVTAVVLAILQLVFSHVFPRLSGLTLVLEVLSVLSALIAVGIGIRLHFHHHWLANRQAAERLRSLKFQSLAWHELWCDLDGWKARVRLHIESLRALTEEDAIRWTTESDDAAPESAIDPGCEIDMLSLKAIVDYYRVKRLGFQKHYFDRQSGRANRYSWAHHWRMSLVIFFSSVLIVIVHGCLGLYLSIDGGTGDHAASDDSHGHDLLHKIEFCLVGLAAILPVIGFGLRAWMSAFEFPRSRNLFRAKSLALDEPIKQLEAFPSGEDDPMTALRSIAQSEYFLITEHREWCRLQTEAEWFL